MACGQLAQKAGQRWFGAVQVWQDERLDTYLSAVWEPGHKEAWLLISDQSAGPIQAYKYRFFTPGRGRVPALGVFVVFDVPFPFVFSS
jgi:hypothetical protein